MLTIDRLELAAELDRLVTLLPRLTPRGGLSMVAAATLADLERRGSRRITELAETQGVTQPAMTGLVGRLAAGGLVERAPDPADRRGVLVTVTEDGRAVLAARRRARAEALAALLDDLDADDHAALAAAMGAIGRLVTKGPPHDPPASPFRQPRAVWAVAFACVDLVHGHRPRRPDPAGAVRRSWTPRPSQVTLLFTSYLVVTAVAMLVTGWVSSRIGAKRTLIAGLVADRRVRGPRRARPTRSAASSASAPAGGWATRCSSRPRWRSSSASASGGFAGAIVLYETALGVGIAAGPLRRRPARQHQLARPVLRRLGAHGDRAGRDTVLLPPTPSPRTAVRSSAPLKALRHRGLLTMGVTALLYNWGFFTMLGYAPFPMDLSITSSALVFFGWGVLVALFSVFVAPRLQAPLRHRPHAVRQPRAVRRRARRDRGLHRLPGRADRRA